MPQYQGRGECEGGAVIRERGIRVGWGGVDGGTATMDVDVGTAAWYEG